LGLILVSTIGFLAKYSLTIPEATTTPLFLLIITILAFLLPFFTYGIKKDMVKLQKAIDDLATELKDTRKALNEKTDPLQSRQEPQNSEIEDKPWDELTQAEKDKHIAKIQKTMIYTGSPGSGLDIIDPPDIIHIGTYYEENIEFRA